MSKQNQTLLLKFQGVYQLESWLGLIAGLLVLLATLVMDPPAGMTVAAWRCTGMGTLMAIWWSTEAIPIPATALLPIVLIPALGLGDVKAATTPYANPTIYLFLGGFMIGLAMEKCNLHKRIALTILDRMGSNPARQIAGFMIATGFISMWVSNTATAIMMTPIGLSVADMVTRGEKSPEANRYSTALLLSIAYAASIGGIATLIGTPPNALLRAFLEEHYKIHVGFGQWMLLGVPVAVIMMGFCIWWLTRVPFTFQSAGDSDGHSLLKKEIAALGPWSKAEKRVGVVFTLAALCWMFQPLIATVLPRVDDTLIAMAAGLALFLIPVNAGRREFLMDWQQAGKLPWGILILFGGGLSLAGVINSSKLATWLASQLNTLSGVHVILMIFVVVTVIMFLTEVTSNTATAAAFLPLVGAMAVAQGVSPALFAIPAAIAASCAFMLPVATPPNAIVFGSGEMPISAMIKAGFALNFFGIFAVTGLCALLVNVLW